MVDSNSLRLRLLICVLLAIVTFAAFHQVLKHDFINYDDDFYVYENQHVRAGLTPSSVSWAFTSVYVATWQPMVWLSYMLDREIFGMNAWGFHLTNLLIHVGNVLLLFGVLVMMTGKPWRSAFVALLFGIHPLHVESVAWVAERKDVLSTLFWLLTMWAYVRYVRHRSVRSYLPVVGFFVLGLMAKPMLVSLPFVLLLMDYWPLGRLPSDGKGRLKVALRLVYEKLPLLGLVCASSVLTVIAQGAGGALAPTELWGFGVRAANALVSYVAYMVKMVWPVGLAVPYIHPGDTLPTWQVVGSLVVLLAISALVFVKGRRYPVLAVGWLWYLVTLVPVIGLVQIGWHAMADRFTYVPLIGLFIAVAWVISDLDVHLIRRASVDTPRLTPGYVPIGLAIAIPAVLYSVTATQVGHWKNSITLFEHTVRVTGENPVAHSNLGIAYWDAGQRQKAVEHYRKAVEAEPSLASTRFSLASALYMMKRLDEAADEYSAVLDIDPNFPDARNNLMAVLDEMAGTSKPKENDAQHQEAMRHFTRGMEYGNQRRAAEAIREYEQALRIKPDFA